MRVQIGEEIVIAKGGRPVVARLVPYRRRVKRPFGVDRGVVEVPSGYDAPLDAVLASFEE